MSPSLHSCIDSTLKRENKNMKLEEEEEEEGGYFVGMKVEPCDKENDGLPWHGSFQKLLVGSSDDEEGHQKLGLVGFVEQESCVTGLSDQISDSCTQQEEEEEEEEQGGKGKKRKRKRVTLNKKSQEAESQRMTHIQVERDRRKQMNGHLTVLRSMLPQSYLQKGDQASVVGAAIDLVKELEQFVQSLKLKRVKRKGSESEEPSSGLLFKDRTCSVRSSCSGKGYLDSYSMEVKADDDDEALRIAELEVTLIESHGSVKVLSRKKRGQLLTIIAALENFHITVMHLNITTVVDERVLFSFSIKMEEQCKLTTAHDVATTVQHVLRIVHTN